MNVNALRSDLNEITGDVCVPGDGRYDVERLGWNRSVDSHPAAVVSAATPDDVRVAVRAARWHDVPLAVRATGHGTVRPADGGLLVSTSRLAGVRVDPDRRTARVGAGAGWAGVIAAAGRYGLAPLSGTPSVGVTGYTLGGGAGHLSRRYGLAADSLLRAELVTADGGACTASATEHPDLFWALRGGSGNFGVVTALEFRLYPVERVAAGMTLHPIDRAADVIAAYRAWAPSEPDELNTAIVLLRMPDTDEAPEPMRGRRLLGVRAFHLGSAQRAERLLAPVLAAAGPPVAGGLAEGDFPAGSAALGGGAPAPPCRFVQHVDLADDLPYGLVDVLTGAMAGDETPNSVEIRHWGGAMARPGPDAGPAGHRDTPYSVLVTALGGAATPGGRAVAGVAERLRRYATGGTFLNFLTDPARTASAFTPDNHRRLAGVKATWDPDNVFRRNHNIPPAERLEAAS